MKLLTMAAAVLGLLGAPVFSDSTCPISARGGDPKLPTPGAVLVLEPTNPGSILGNSVLRALNELGVTYDYMLTDDYIGIDFDPYDTVIFATSGGHPDPVPLRCVTRLANEGKRLILIGGSAYEDFRYAVWVDLDPDYSWAIPAAPHFILTNPGPPLGVGLPAAHDFSDERAAYYMGRCTDSAAEAAAENGDGWPCLFSKRIADGIFSWFINSPRDVYWTDPDDFALLKQIIWNLLHTRIRTADTLLIHTTDVTDSVAAALTDLGCAFDQVEVSTDTDLDMVSFSGYETVILAMNGGTLDGDNMARLADFASAGGRLIGLGGANHQPFVNGVDDHLFEVNRDTYSWIQTISPHFAVVDHHNRLSVDLPGTHDYGSEGPRYYCLRPIGSDVECAAENGYGRTCLLRKRMGYGWVGWFIHPPTSDFWTVPADYEFLKNLLFAMLHMEERAVCISPGWNMIPYPSADTDDDIHVDDCRWHSGGTHATWDEAASSGWFQDPGFYYTPGAGYGAIGKWMAADDTYFRYGFGYWLLSYGNTDIHLILPGPR